MTVRDKFIDMLVYENMVMPDNAATIMDLVEAEIASTIAGDKSSYVGKTVPIQPPSFGQSTDIERSAHPHDLPDRDVWAKEGTGDPAQIEWGSPISGYPATLLALIWPTVKRVAVQWFKNQGLPNHISVTMLTS